MGPLLMGYIHPFRHNQVFLWGPKPGIKIKSVSDLLIGKINLLGSRYKTIMLTVLYSMYQESSLHLALKILTKRRSTNALGHSGKPFGNSYSNLIIL